jgi:hypothetical protein
MSNVGGSCKREGRKKREIRASAQNFMDAINEANGLRPACPQGTPNS